MKRFLFLYNFVIVGMNELLPSSEWSAKWHRDHCHLKLNLYFSCWIVALHFPQCFLEIVWRGRGKVKNIVNCKKNKPREILSHNCCFCNSLVVSVFLCAQLISGSGQTTAGLVPNFPVTDWNSFQCYWLAIFVFVFLYQVRALVSCIQPGLVICFTLDRIHVSMLFSWNIPPSPSPTESKRLFYTLFFCFAYRVIINIFLNSIYMC